MATDALSPYSSLRREISERLHSFFVNATDGRAVSLNAGAALASSQGPHREQNEDRSAIVRFRFGSVRPDLRLAILCDGMGGMAKGGEAAALAIGSFISSFATIEVDCPLDERLKRSCSFANKAVFNAYRGEAGTTLTAIAFANQARFAVHVGDSRLYGIDEALHIDLLTKDDTVSGAVNAHLGQSAEDEMDNRLLQFVGIGEAMLPSVIDVSGDNDHNLWLLTSDGAHSVGRRTLNGICEGSKSPYDLVRKLVYVSEAMNTQDNATAICIRSGFIAASTDEHEGLTLQIYAPNNNLEIWLPPSAVRLAEVTRKLLPSDNAQIENAPSNGGHENLPMPSTGKRKPRKVVKKSLSSSLKIKRPAKKKTADNPSRSMDFLFKPGNGNND